MYAFRMTMAVAAEFYRRAGLLEVDNEENRNNILLQMVEEGLVDGVTKTNKTPEEYLEHLKSKFDVLDLTQAGRPNEPDPEERIDAVWCRDSETGEYVLVDRITNKEIMRGKPI
jgi:hypothetical protein